MASVTVLDGGMGRELARIGAPFRQPEWSALAMIESPEHVRRVHGSFVAAGARVITTNAYALVPFHIGAERFAVDGRRLAALAGSLARAVADAHAELGVRVAGCLPPVLGSYQPELFTADAARPILEVLVDAQAPFVDVWLAETQSSIDEVRLVRDVLDAAGSPAADRQLWVSYTLADELVDRVAVLRSGEPVSEAATAVVALGAEVVSFNCSPPEVMEAAVREAADAVDVAIGVYANAFDLAHETAANTGLHDVRDDVTPSAYRALAERWVAAGASVVGGCCGVGPEHIAALATALR